MKIYIPAKTFICGEYNVLNNNSGVLIASYPEFKATITPTEESNVLSLFHKKSTASVFAEMYYDYFQNYRIDYEDPFGRHGGFGWSGAQFLILYVAYHKKIKVSEAFRVFQLLSEDVRIASGADIVAQIFGKITFFEPDGRHYSSEWPFHDIDILIFKTDSKVNTAEHLAEIDLHVDNHLNRLVNKVKMGILNKNIENITDGINSYYERLRSLNLVSESSMKYVDEIKELCPDTVMAVKGCGALCNDVIITVNNSIHSEEVKRLVESLGLRYISSSRNLHEGLRVEC